MTTTSNSFELIDTHAHIYLEELEKDLSEILERGKESGVSNILLPAIDMETHPQLHKLSEIEGCKPMMGLHPCSVKENFAEELKLVREFLGNGNYIAVGEIGLDFYWDTSFSNQQQLAFEEQLQLAIDKKLPVSIHSRNATEECIETVKNFTNLKGAFHCFSGSVEQAKRIMDLGLYLGIGGVVTFKKSGLDEVIRQVGLSQVILETDAPYLAPVPFRGKRNEPAYLKYIAEHLAQVMNLSVEEIAEVTTKNAKSLFRL